MGITKRIRSAVMSFLRIQPAESTQFAVRELMDYKANAFKNQIWYRGDSYELDQLYKQIENHNASFWGSVPTKGMEIRKVHTGLPKTIVNTLTNLVVSDLSEIKVDNAGKQELWDQIADENKFDKVIRKATKNILVSGDGAFKISFDPEVSTLPIIEFVSGENIEIVSKRGRVSEIQFYSEYRDKKGNKFMLREDYGFGYVKYHLYRGENEVGVEALEETAHLVDIGFDKSIMLAVPYMLQESDKYEGRGQSIFDSKIDNFDSLDEAWSQWMDALRTGRAKTYIPETLLPRNPETGEVIRPNAFDNRFIKIESDLAEGATNKVDTQQPAIPTNDYLATYVTALDLCLQGIVSPSTLGIDVKKLDNAEAQREKEKTTLYTRGTIIEALTAVIKAVVNVALQANDLQSGQAPTMENVTVSFGEYATPSFESVVETLSNPNTPMSIEAKVAEMWGGSKDEQWIEEEIRRVKEQSGIITMDEPALNNEPLF